ncbi:MAG: flippase-like domain-containing protein [Candidatus Marinimicrobia bacterium]|nr:flippase-like domain-containing protein [Candidatus Neomarinimicrobiota bacterium]
MRIIDLVKEHPWKFLISIAVSLGLVYFSFKDLAWEPFWQAVLSINYWLFAAGAFLLVFSNVVRAARWKILLSPQKTIKTNHLFEATMMGYMGNNVLPFRLGEVLRAMVVSKRHDLKVSGVGASIVVERALDMFSFLILAGIYATLVPTFESARLLAILGLSALFMIIILGFWVNRQHEKFQVRIESWRQGFIDGGHPKRAEHLVSIFKGLETMWHMPKPFMVILQTGFLWLLYFMVTFLALAAFDFGLDLVELWKVSSILLVFTTLSLSVPAAPGYVGTYHGAVLAALMIFNIDNDAAKAFAIVMHLMNYLLYTPMGAWYLMKAGLTLDLAKSQSDLAD